MSYPAPGCNRLEADKHANAGFVVECARAAPHLPERHVQRASALKAGEHRILGHRCARAHGGAQLRRGVGACVRARGTRRG